MRQRPSTPSPELASSCPLCGQPVPFRARYARSICVACLQLAVDSEGRPLRFANISLSGGLQVDDGTGWREIMTAAAWVNGVPCRIQEARFGGVVGQPQTDLESERVAACLLGGAMGDALGAPIEFDSVGEIRGRHGRGGLRRYAPAHGRRGAITDDTQMTLFTAEGLLCAQAAGIGSNAERLAYLAEAYRRWLATQEPGVTASGDGWLLSVPGLHERRAPGATCLRALIQQRPVEDSKGCGGVMRVAPIGLVFDDPFELASDAARLTHGHPSGYLAAGAFAEIVAGLRCGVVFRQSVDAAMARLCAEAGHDEVSRALLRALELADGDAPGTPETVETLGAGWVAEEALAISVYCAAFALRQGGVEDGPKAELRARAELCFREGLVRAVNHSGDSDSTGSLTGNLLGAVFGPLAIPGNLRASLELAPVISRIANDLVFGCLAPSGRTRDWRNRYRAEATT